jgi:UDP-N-acetylmuramoyl-tripeptide--D-alanyl-D-alanine ligase
VSAASLPVNAAEFSIAEILAATGGRLHCGDESLRLGRVVTDTRLLNRIAPQSTLDEAERAFDRLGAQFSRAPEPILPSLFIALRGENFDGHRFLEKAFELGAGAAIVEESALGDLPAGQTIIIVQSTLMALGDLARFHRRRFAIPVVAITGSYGKTTTRAFLETVLRPSFKVLASQENFNNEIGVPLTLLQLDSTHGVAILEMGMRGAGQIKYLAQVALPTVGIITNIGPQHIELLGGLENIARAKAELLECLPSDGIAILPADSEFLALLKSKSPRRVATFGKAENSDIRVRDISTNAEGGIEFTMDLAGWRTTLPFPGAHNAVNAAAVMALLDEGYDIFSISLENAFAKFHTVQIPGARMRILKSGGLTIIDDSYNAGPNSMQSALETLRDFPAARRRVAILGSMKELGDWSESEHRKIGEQLRHCADVLLAVGDEAKVLYEAAGIEKRWCANAEEAAKIATEMVREGDVALVKGSRSVGLEKVVSALES